MAYRKIIDIFVKYLLLILMLVLHICSLYDGVVTIIDKMNRNIHIWTNVLIISAIICGISNLLIVDLLTILKTGKTLNIIQDIEEESSQNIAVMYNGLVAGSLFLIIACTLSIIHMATGLRLFSKMLVILSTLGAISSIVYILAGYFKIKYKYIQSIHSNIPDQVVFPVIICIIQLLITQNDWVGYIYRSIYRPSSNFLLTLVLIIVLCYFFTVIFCYFSNIYFLLGFLFFKRDLNRIQRKIDYIQEKEEKYETILRESAQAVDEKSEQYNCIQKIGLAISFCIIHIKIYLQRRICSARYLLSLLNFRITKRFRGLLEPERIRINSIRFCLVTAVLELLSLNLILFIYLESDNPCLKFFELLSTVIIIPILLSWLGELKLKSTESSERNRKDTKM